MTTPSQLNIALPPSFRTSFWSSPAYRRGVQHLYSRLQTGLDENHNVLQIIQHRADAEFAHADNLATQAARQPYPAPPLFKDALTFHARPKHGLVHLEGESLGVDEDADSSDAAVAANYEADALLAASTSRARGESTLAISQAIRAIEAESLLTQANAHAKVASNLERLVLIPFRKWSAEHRDRVTSSWNHVDAAMQRFERQHADTQKLRATYENKCRLADEAEDDARFAPSVLSPPPDHGHATFQNQQQQPHQQASSELTRAASTGGAPASSDKLSNAPLDKDRIQRRETLRQQFGFRSRPSGGEHHPANSTQAETGLGEFAGVTVPVASPDASRSSSTSGRRSVGSQQDSATLVGSGDELDEVPLGSLTPGSTNLKRSATLSSYLSSAVGRISGESASSLAASVKGLVGGLSEPRHIRARREAEAAERAYAEAVIGLDRTRCVLEEILHEHFGLLQRFELDRLKAVKAVLISYHASFSGLVPALSTSLARIGQIQKTISPEADLQRMIAEGRTGPYKPVAQVFHPYYHDDRASLAGEGNGGFGMNLDAYTRAEALAREDSTGDVSGAADPSKRQSLHGRNPSLAGPNKGMPAVPLVLGTLLSALERAYADPKRWPQPDAKAGEEGDKSALLLASAEKRKSWIYEVPLPTIHRLRDLLIEPHRQRALAALADANGTAHHPGASPLLTSADAFSPPSNVDLDRYDPPVLAATLKVWALELEQSLIPAELWESAAAVYEAAAGQEREARAKKGATAPATAGGAEKGVEAKDADNAAADKEVAPGAGPEKGKGRASNVSATGAPVPEPLDPEVEAKIRADVISDLTALLSKLPKIHLACLDAVIGHLHNMVKATTTDEPERVYLQKLGLSLGRVLLRPKLETPATLQATHPTLLAIDLVANYDAIFPDLLARKARESELSAVQRRAMPVRKRTKPVDQRLSRSQMQAQMAEAARQGKAVPPLPAGFVPAGAGVGAGAGAGAGPGAASSVAASVSNAASQAVDGARKLGQRIVTSVEKSAQQAASPLSISPGDGVGGGGAKAGEEGEGVPPTPIEARVLQGARADTGSLRGSESQAQAQAEGQRQAQGPTSTTNAPEAPLSNVARLSRQFGATTSATTTTTGVRGPRPAGARSARPSGGDAAAATTAAPSAGPRRAGADRESKDLAPSTSSETGLGDNLKRSRRRSWSRTVDSSDALAAATGDDEEE